MTQDFVTGPYWSGNKIFTHALTVPADYKLLLPATNGNMKITLRIIGTRLNLYLISSPAVRWDENYPMFITITLIMSVQSFMLSDCIVKA